MVLSRLVTITSLLLLVGCGATKSRFDNRTKDIIAGATKVEVFRIDGEEDPDKARPSVEGERKISGYSVTSQGPDQGKEFADKLAAFLLDEESYSNTSAKCFWPGVAFRIWKGEESVDVLICFKCDNLYCGPPVSRARDNASFGRLPSRRHKLLDLAKVAFPTDEEIQALNDK